MITQRKAIFGGGIAAAAIGALIGFGSASAVASDTSVVDVASMSEARSEQDRLPDFLAAGPQSHEGIDPASTRYQGAVEGVHYWLANDHLGQLCIVSLADGPDQLSGSTCGDEEVITENGLSLGFTIFATELEYRAHFVPDDWSLRGSNLNSLSPNLSVEVIPEGSESVSSPTITDGQGHSVELDALETS